MIKIVFERPVLDRDTPRENIALLDTWASDVTDKLNYLVRQLQKEKDNEK
jgi:hypothetical protein